LYPGLHRFVGVCLWEPCPGGEGVARCAACGHEVPEADALAGLVRPCDKAERPKVPEHERPRARNLPSLPAMAWNLAAALATFVLDGLRTVTRERYEERLRICNACIPPEGYLIEEESRCSHPKCGCFLSLKARGRVWQCGAGKWPELDDTS